jgi:hypothetical protein
LGTEFTIKIDEPTLQRLRTEYGDLLEDMDTRLADYQWDSGETYSDLTLGDQFPLSLGGAEFAQAVKLAKELDKVRKNLTGRFDTVYSNASNLYWGLQSLLEDTDAVEHLNQMTAEEFSEFIPTETTQGPGDGPTGQGKGS